MDELLVNPDRILPLLLRRFVMDGAAVACVASATVCHGQQLLKHRGGLGTLVVAVGQCLAWGARWSATIVR
jgi:hypothetical protein